MDWSNDIQGVNDILAKTVEELRKSLSADEPDYVALSKDLDPEDLPNLRTLKQTEDPLMASKAVYLSSLISDKRSIEILKDAADDPRPEVRIAAASGSANFVSTASMRDTLSSVDVSGVEEVLNKLRNDSDVGVSKTARKSLGSVGDRIHK